MRLHLPRNVYLAICTLYLMKENAGFANAQSTTSHIKGALHPVRSLCHALVVQTLTLSHTALGYEGLDGLEVSFTFLEHGNGEREEDR